MFMLQSETASRFAMVQDDDFLNDIALKNMILSKELNVVEVVQ
jgi:hypothetical protein